MTMTPMMAMTMIMIRSLEDYDEVEYGILIMAVCKYRGERERERVRQNTISGCGISRLSLWTILQVRRFKIRTARTSQH